MSAMLTDVVCGSAVHAAADHESDRVAECKDRVDVRRREGQGPEIARPVLLLLARHGAAGARVVCCTWFPGCGPRRPWSLVPSGGEGWPARAIPIAQVGIR